MMADLEMEGIGAATAFDYQWLLGYSQNFSAVQTVIGKGVAAAATGTAAKWMPPATRRWKINSDTVIHGTSLDGVWMRLSEDKKVTLKGLWHVGGRGLLRL